MPHDNNNNNYNSDINAINLLNKNNVPQTHPSSSLLTEVFMKDGKEINIISMESKVLQTPKPENHNIAICQVEITTNDNRKAADFGCASPDTTGSDSPIALLESARTQAAQRVLGIAGALSTFTESKSQQEPEQNVFDVQPQVIKKPAYGNSSATTHNHSRINPMSEAQSKMLKSMAQKKQLNLEQLAREFVGKNVSDLTSYDANMLIQKIQSMS